MLYQEKFWAILRKFTGNFKENLGKFSTKYAVLAKI